MEPDEPVSSQLLFVFVPSMSLRKLDTDNSGTLTLNEFQAVPGLENNPLVKRVMEVFDADHSGAVDFNEFILALSIFSSSEHKEEKMKFAFKIYDVKGDGYISNGDLFHILKTMVGDNLEDVQLQQLVDRTIMQGDADHDGKLTFEEFAKVTTFRPHLHGNIFFSYLFVCLFVCLFLGLFICVFLSICMNVCKCVRMYLYF
jgi:serine/threonine-protein phosphatase 2B regulatory subunit